MNNEINDTPVFHAFVIDHMAGTTVWKGMGTREAIAKRGFKSDGIVHWCPKKCLKDGWRDR